MQCIADGDLGFECSQRAIWSLREHVHTPDNCESITLPVVTPVRRSCGSRGQVNVLFTEQANGSGWAHSLEFQADLTSQTVLRTRAEVDSWTAQHRKARKGILLAKHVYVSLMFACYVCSTEASLACQMLMLHALCAIRRVNPDYAQQEQVNFSIPMLLCT
jgi:hypothetical protein